jgi:hypothetical protein
LVCWRLWKQRNARVFNNISKQYSALGLVMQVLADWNHWIIDGIGGREAFARVVHWDHYCVWACVVSWLRVTTIVCNGVVTSVTNFLPSIEIWYAIGYSKKNRSDPTGLLWD